MQFFLMINIIILSLFIRNVLYLHILLPIQTIKEHLSNLNTDVKKIVIETSIY